MNGIFLSLRVLLRSAKDAEKLLKKCCICVQMRHDVNLVEEDEGVENRESWVVQDPGEYDVLEIL